VVEVHGTKGAVKTEGDKIVLWKPDPEPNEPPLVYDGPQTVIEDMVAVIRRGGKPRINGEEGTHSLRLILAIYESARTGKEIAIS
jgi:predicted dehydrogenase